MTASALLVALYPPAVRERWGTEFLALYLIAHSGRVEHPTGFARAGLIACYWGTLAFAALRLCALVDRVARICAVPTTPRLRAAFILFGIGTALAAAQSLLTTVRAGASLGSLVATLALGVVAATTVWTGQDLGRPGA